MQDESSPRSRAHHLEKWRPTLAFFSGLNTVVGAGSEGISPIEIAVMGVMRCLNHRMEWCTLYNIYIYTQVYIIHMCIYIYIQYVQINICI